MAIAFKKAVKAESKLRMALAGPSGSGKTFSALSLATTLAGDKPVAVIDTERGSASKYADLFTFDVLELDDFHPDRYVEAIQTAAQAGYGVVVIDSLSHAWNGSGGLLEQVESIGKRKYNGNSFKAWGDVKPIENRLVEAITGSNIHVIATMRSKTEYVVEQNERGKATPRKVGTAPVQRDGFEYEFDVFGEMTSDNELMIQKTRCPALTGQVIPKPGAGLAQVLAEWLHGAPASSQTPSRQAIPATIIDPATWRMSGSQSSSEVEASQASAPPDRVSRAMLDVDVLKLLNKMGRRENDDCRVELKSVIGDIETDGRTVNLKAIKTELQRRLDQAAELSTLDTGSIGA